MATTIITKHGVGVPANSSVKAFELAVDPAAGTLYTSTDGTDVVAIVGGGSVPDTTQVIAGAGMTGGGALSGNVTLDVVGGTGITANANDITIDATVATLTGTQTLTNKTNHAANGTAALPTHSFTSDTNLGMYRAGTDILAFSTASTERLRIDAADIVTLGPTANKRVTATSFGLIDGATGAITAGGTGDFSCIRTGVGQYSITWNVAAAATGSQSVTIGMYSGGNSLTFSVLTGSATASNITFATTDTQVLTDPIGFTVTRTYI
jgi:hypothetical protein